MAKKEKKADAPAVDVETDAVAVGDSVKVKLSDGEEITGTVESLVGGKASGSMDDIKAGAFVTVTMNGKGKVTNVLVTSTSGFGGGRRPAN